MQQLFALFLNLYIEHPEHTEENDIINHKMCAVSLGQTEKLQQLNV